MKTIGLSLRGDGYYNRNSWAGRMKLADGTPILDSPFSNGMAHQLHMALFLAGETPETSAFPLSVSAQMRRANPIESCDTAVLKIMLKGNIPLVFYGSHAADVGHDPELVIECEKARIDWTYPACRIFFENEKTETVENDPNEVQYEHLYDSLHARLSGEKAFFCSTRNAASHTGCIDLAYRDCRILDFPPEMVEYNRELKARTVRGLGATILDAWQKNIFPLNLPEIARKSASYRPQSPARDSCG